MRHLVNSTFYKIGMTKVIGISIFYLILYVYTDKYGIPEAGVFIKKHTHYI